MEEINLYKLLRFYVQNWLLIVSIALIGLAAGLAYNQFIQTPMYKSNATLLFVNPSGVSSTQDSTRLSNYVELFQSRRVLEPVMGEQKIGITFDQFIGSVSATNDKGTEVIRLSVSTDDPKKSRDFLRAAVISFENESKEIYGANSLRVVDNASDATPPYNVKKELQLAIATGAGFVVSLIALFFIYDASSGKAGKLRLKKQAEKAQKVEQPAKLDDPETSTTKPKSKVKAFFAQLRSDFKDGLWIEPSYTDDESIADDDSTSTAPKPSKDKK